MDEVSQRYKNLKETLDYLKQRRDESQSDEEKNNYTRKISLAKKNLNTFKNTYKDRIYPNLKKEIEQTQPKKIPLNRQPLKQKFQEIENKAKQLIQQATTEEEKKSIQERLEAVRLRLKYSY